MSDTVSIRDAVERRLARRHRSERRFQAYGLIAIAAAISFLALLVWSSVVQSIPAWTAHRLTLEVELTPERVDPRGDLSASSLRRGEYNALMQDALRAQFPDVQSRAELLELYGLYSALNSADLLNQVVSNPDLVGQTYAFTFPISDDADLYLEGQTLDETRQPGSAPLRFETTSDGVALVSEHAVFEAFALAIRSDAEARIERALTNAARAEAEANSAPNADAREAFLAQAQRARALAARLDARAAPDQALQLGPQLPSLLVELQGGVIKIEEISADFASAQGDVILAPDPSLERADWTMWTLDIPAAGRLITDRQIVWTRALEQRGYVERQFNTLLFTNADSREPELAGLRGAFIGSILTMLITMVLAVPVGIGAAIYLEEFAPKNRLTELIEVNINNLAAVPSIVFGLGLAVFLNLWGLPRSAPLVGGMVLALMTLPTVIISSRAALKAVPPSIREAALGVGASKTQAVFHHVLPLAAPGMLTGAIIGLAQALGETAPLLMIGMVAFVADAPSLGFSGFGEPATVLPVQIFIWASSAERAYEALTAAAIIALLGLMVVLNAAAIYLRRRFERRW